MNRKSKQFKKRKKRDKESSHSPSSTELIYGINTIIEALLAKKRKFFQIYIAEKRKNKQINRIEDLARSNNIYVSHVSAELISTMVSDEKSQNVVAKVSAPVYQNFEKFVMKFSDLPDNLFLVALDGVTDPRNFGAIIRSAEVLGSKGVIFSSKGSASYTKAAAKSSAGAGEHLPLLEVESLNQAIDFLKKEGNFKIIGFENKSESIAKLPDGKIVLIFGDEGRGISESILKKCDMVYKIPMQGKIDSLNVSASVAIGSYIASTR